MKPGALLLMFFGAAAAQDSLPNLAISANGATRVELPQGWPLIVRTLVMPARNGASQGSGLRLAPESGAWFDGLAIHVTSVEGREVVWALKPAALPPDPQLALKRDEYVGIEWVLDAENTAQLEPGAYSLTAVLSIDGGEGWNGRISARPVRITVVPAPAELTPEKDVELARLRMRAAVLADRLDEATAHIDALLDRQPTSIAGLQTKAALLLDAGKAPLAFLPAMQALSEFQKNDSGTTEPPSELLKLLQRIRAAVAVYPAK